MAAIKWTAIGRGLMEQTTFEAKRCFISQGKMVKHYELHEGNSWFCLAERIKPSAVKIKPSAVIG